LHDKFLTRFYTEQEAEFYDLGYDEALFALRGRETIGASGLNREFCGSGMAAQQGS